MRKIELLYISAVLVALLLSACGGAQGSTASEQPTAATITMATVEPTPTEEIFALKINGETISEEELAGEIERIRATDELIGVQRSDEERRTFAIDELIGIILLAQDAYANGFTYTDADHQTRIATLVAELGSQSELDQWIDQQGYTPDTFRSTLERAVAAGYTRDRLVAQVPFSGKQYHVQELLLYDRPTAEYYYNQYLAGADFNTLASNIDPITRGDIGWFPLGYLPDPIIESAVSQMQVDQVSEIIEGNVGFYILKLLAIDENRELSPDALLQAQKKALNDWITTKRQASEIVIR